MKKIIFIFCIILAAVQLYSQDVEVFHRYQDDKLIMPVFPEKMTFDEFQILSRDIRFVDMAAGLAFPGYISFKAKEKTAGYIAMGIRAAGYAGALYEIIKYNEEGASAVFGNQADRNFAYITMGILVSSYLFDWIYGKTQLERKQESIRYKYRQPLN